MDWILLNQYIDKLKTIRRITDLGHVDKLPSIFPPDSIPSWISIFTGLDPSEHGILESIDYFKKDVKGFSVNLDTFKGKTFWDAAGEIGKKVIVVNPLLAYPPWEVNGVMASGPVFMSGEVKTYPPEVKERFDIPPLGGIVDFPTKKELADFAEKTRRETEQIVDFSIELLKHFDWDVSFISLLTLDRVSHFFWRFQDENDPTYPGKNELENVIKDFYLFIDSSLDRMLEAAGEDTMLLVVSDHGHGRRPTLLFNLNQLLMEHGYLKSKIKGPRLLSARYYIERLKDLTLETLHRLDMEDLSYRIAKIFPWTRKLKKGDFITDSSTNIASASKFGGTNPFGGIDISKKLCEEKGLSYEKVRDEIIELCKKVHGKDGNPVFKWIKRREELYSGPFLKNFPDLLYEMDPRYGTNWSVHLPLITVNPRHRKISGGHRRNGVFIVGPLKGWKINPENISPLNIRQSVLNFLTEGRASESAKRKSFLERD